LPVGGDKGGFLTRLLNLMVLVAVVTAGCSVVADYKAYELKDCQTRLWGAAGVTRLKAMTENGGIKVTAAGSDSIEAEITRSVTGKDSADAAAHLESVVVAGSLNGDLLELTATMPTSGERDYGAAFEVEAPGFADLDLETANGGISVVEHSGSATVVTSNGQIDCDLLQFGATDTADLSTSNGNVVLSLPSDASASFRTETSNGSITITGFGSIEYTTNEPTLKIGRIGTGEATIDIHTSNGNITIESR
jgi:hypothetical protein